MLLNPDSFAKFICKPFFNPFRFLSYRRTACGTVKFVGRLIVFVNMLFLNIDELSSCSSSSIQIRGKETVIDLRHS